MTSNEQALTDQMVKAVLDAKLDEEEVISVIRNMRKEIETLTELISDEGMIVDNLFDILTTLSKPLKHVNVDLSLLPVEKSEVEKANISYDGKLIIMRKDAGIQLINLMDEDNRDLLTKVLADVLPKLLDLIKDPSMHLEAEILELVTPDPQIEPIEEDSVKPEMVEDIELEMELEPTIIEESMIIEPEPSAPIIEVLTSEPKSKQVIPKDIPAERNITIQELRSKPKVKKIIVEQLPKRGEEPLRKLRNKVKKQSDLTRKQMEIIKRVRMEKIKKIREDQESVEPEWVQNKGIVSKIKKLIKKLGL